MIYPFVSITFHLCPNSHFNRDLAPAFRLANDNLNYIVKQGNIDKTIKKSSVDILFKDGKSTSYNPFGKDSVQIFKDLAQLGRGNYWLKNQRRHLEPPTIGKPELTYVD